MTEVPRFTPASMDSLERGEHSDGPKLGAIVEMDGVKYRWSPVATGKDVYDRELQQRVPGAHTYRTYFSHSTPEAGPGPGWDYRFKLLDKDVALTYYGRTFTHDQVLDPAENMPDELFLTLSPLEEDQ